MKGIIGTIIGFVLVMLVLVGVFVLIDRANPALAYAIGDAVLDVLKFIK